MQALFMMPQLNLPSQLSLGDRHEPGETVPVCDGLPGGEHGMIYSIPKCITDTSILSGFLLQRQILSSEWKKRTIINIQWFWRVLWTSNKKGDVTLVSTDSSLQVTDPPLHWRLSQIKSFLIVILSLTNLPVPVIFISYTVYWRLWHCVSEQSMKHCIKNNDKKWFQYRVGHFTRP